MFRAVRFAIAAALLTLAMAGCVQSSSATPAANVTHPAITPTPTPNPAAIRNRAAANLRDLRTAQFEITHDPGSIYVNAFGARITGARGTWSARQGAQIAVDAYLVHGPDAGVDTGAYVLLQTVITPDGYYATDPLSGIWHRQSVALLPLPVAELNDIVAEMVATVAIREPASRDTIDGVATYKISGTAPASTLNWLLLYARDGQSVGVTMWIDAADTQLRKVRISGPVGRFDAPDTVREIRLYDLNNPVTITPPAEYVDLTGG